jgi:ABC-type bacteriocin/lantibiotic exporter with double-glycine peptidase domain
MNKYTIDFIQWLEQLNNSSLALDTQNIINNISSKWEELTNNKEIQQAYNTISTFNASSFIDYITAPIYILQLLIYGTKAFLIFFYWLVYYIFIFMCNILKFIYIFTKNILNPPFRYLSYI